MVHNMLKYGVQICFGKPVYKTFRYFFHVEMRFDLKDPARHCIRIYTVHVFLHEGSVADQDGVQVALSVCAML